MLMGNLTLDCASAGKAVDAIRTKTDPIQLTRNICLAVFLLTQLSTAVTGLNLPVFLNEVKDLDRGNGEILHLRLAWKSFHEEYIGKRFEVKPIGFFSAPRAFSRARIHL